MIVVDTSVFIDAIFEYNPSRTGIARKFFRTVQDTRNQVVEPDIFKIELIGQLVRRMEHKKAISLYELIVERVEIVDTAQLREVSFEVALKTGCRAIDSFYISVAHARDAILVSNDRFQVESALKYGIKAFYLLEEWQELNKLLKNRDG
ncbi:type II toxin-antitoxin system VapC family toxin [Thermococcus sp.]|uniref:type II toxin-antitoxin system VapC family toxin n=1 Tax=Thermococcus sp. TaxID=35749 RepID=UPI002618DC3E|nr:type II toxin-antitoxin system VapC family toxin [Thermococcus sp.]